MNVALLSNFTWTDWGWWVMYIPNIKSLHHREVGYYAAISPQKSESIGVRNGIFVIILQTQARRVKARRIYSARKKNPNVTKLYISLLLCVQLLAFI